MKSFHILLVCGLVLTNDDYKIISFIHPLNSQVHCVSDFISLISDLTAARQVTLTAFYKTVREMFCENVSFVLGAMRPKTQIKTD